MKRIIKLSFLVLIVALSAAGCTNDDRVEKSLVGEWTEVYPKPGRSTFIITSGNNMTFIDEDGNSSDYTYRIKGDEIFLSEIGSEIETALSFNKLDPARFNIGYMYPSIYESDPEKFMTFEML